MLSQTSALLHKYRIRLSRRAGQYQVVDRTVLERMMDYAGLSHDDVVLEIGAGIGNLTCMLSRRAGEVFAVERDGRLLKVLRTRLKGCPNVKLLHGDALEIEFPRFNKVVANLPYAISSDITFKLLQRKFELAVLMYQREFAERLVAKPGSDDYSRLTVNVYYHATVELLEEVPPTAFVPQPEVTSMIARVRPRFPPFKVVDEGVFSRVVRALFQHRRQKVSNAFYHSFSQVFPDVEVLKTEKRAIIDRVLSRDISEARVMDLPPEKFGVISDRLAATSP